MTRKQANILRGLITAFSEDKVTLSHATRVEVQAGALDENLRRSREKLLQHIRDMTDKSNDNSK